MDPALRALMTGIIDYAGLFPPARLELDPALRRYVRYRGEADAWMLSRFICPAARLPELAPYDALLAAGGEFHVSVLGRGGADPAAALDGLRQDMRDVVQFVERHRGRVTAEVLEVRLPGEAFASRPRAIDLVAEAGAIVRRFAPQPTRLFIEVPLGPSWRESLPFAVEALLRAEAGFKLRTGGLEPSAFPDPRQISAVLNACRDARIPFKATAGLHHPLRRADATIPATMHGFLNVFGGGVLAAVHRFDEDRLAELMADGEAGSFAFRDGTFGWREWSATADQVRRLRNDFVISFGSCSFDEPREDLAALGLLGAD